VTKTSLVPTQLKHWLDGDLLVLCKGQVWTELLTELQQGANRQRLQKLLPVIAALLGVAALWHWQGSLLVAGLAGGSGSLALYRLLHQPRSLQTLTRQIQRWLRHPQAPLYLSGASGVGILLISYSALAVWQDLQSPWLALMLLTQEVGVLVVLGLAVGLMLTRSQGSPNHTFERCTTGLLHRDAMRRLMAVRQLTQLANQDALTSQERSQAIDYLRLLIRKETEPLVRNAIREGLATLSPAQRQLDRQLGNHHALAARSLTTTPMSLQPKQSSKVVVLDECEV
jgi:hypothetical protein